MFKPIKLCLLNIGSFFKYQLCLSKIVPKNVIQKLPREIGILWELTIGCGLKKTSFGKGSLKKKQSSVREPKSPHSVEIILF